MAKRSVFQLSGPICDGPYNLTTMLNGELHTSRIPNCCCPHLDSQTTAYAVYAGSLPAEVLELTQGLPQPTMSSSDCRRLQQLLVAHVPEPGCRRLIRPGALVGPTLWKVPCAPLNRSFYWAGSPHFLVIDAEVAGILQEFNLDGCRIEKIDRIVAGSFDFRESSRLSPSLDGIDNLMKRSRPLRELCEPPFFVLTSMADMEEMSKPFGVLRCPQGRGGVCDASPASLQIRRNRRLSLFERAEVDEQRLGNCDLQSLHPYYWIASPSLAERIREERIANVALRELRVV